MSTIASTPPAALPPIIEAKGVVKRFGSTVAVDGLSFVVRPGSILGLLGPNGAGKTTTIKLLTTLLPLDGGSATVAGHDVGREADAVRRSIGLAGQSAAVDGKLTVRQNLDLFGRLYHLPRDVRRTRVNELIERFAMADYAHRPAETLSGGEQRRLDLVAALIADPPAIFLDEPTTGLDPRGRQTLWEQIRAIRDQGAAVVLTTQYLEEADQLADHIVIIDQGTVVAAGTTDDLKAELERDILEVTVDNPQQMDAAVTAMGPGRTSTSDGRTLHLAVSSTTESLAALRSLHEAGVGLADYQLRRPTLDDVFIEITGAPPGPVSSGAEGVSA